MDLLSKKRILARKSELETVRSNHLRDWQKITQVIRPSRGLYLSSSSELSKRPTSVINSTPAVASRTLQAGMISGASSPAYAWFKFEFQDPERNKHLPSKAVLEERQIICMEYLASSNFYQVVQTLYGDAADFGNGAGLIVKGLRDPFSAKIYSPGEYVIDVDENGDINTFISEREFTVLQLMQNEDFRPRLSERVKQAYSNGNYGEKVAIVQSIEPNVELQDGKATWHGKPYVKLIFEKDNSNEGENNFLDVSGYDEWPGIDLRWDVASGNIWAQGPGLLALGDALALQTMEFRDAQIVEKAAVPSLQAPISLKNKNISQAPGGITYYDPYSSNGAKIEPLYTISPGILSALDAKIARTESRINEVYYKDLFLMLATTDRREITAREVEEKHQEKLLGLGPVLQRTHRDTLSNALIRVYKMLDRAGLFPPAPADLIGSSITIRYTSALAYAQKAAGATSLERFFGFTGNLVQAYPKVAFKVNPLKGINYYADSIGVPAEVLETDEVAEKNFSSAQQASAAPQQAAAVKDMAQGAALLSQTDTSRPSALQFLLNRGGMP